MKPTLIPALLVAAAFGVTTATAQMTETREDTRPADADAQINQSQKAPQGSRPVKIEDWEQYDVLRASDLLEADIVNAQGEEIGDIEDVVIDPRSGQVRFVIVDTSGFLSLTENLTAIPWQAVRQSAADDGDEADLVVNTTREKLQNAPRFDRTTMREFSDPNWLDQTYEYYGYSILVFPTNQTAGQRNLNENAEYGRINPETNQMTPSSAARNR